jgi:lysophospholipase L1-like esterase
MAEPPPLPDLVRFCHPAKILGATRLPAALAPGDVARLYGSDTATVRAIEAGIAAEVTLAAAALPPVPPVPILALGDSITDDLGSWAEILSARGAEIVNGGLSGDTSTGARARVGRLLEARPELAIVLLGTNDARRQGRDGAPMLVSHAETRRNLRALDAALRRRCDRVIWITPPPVADPALGEPDLIWQRRDVAAKAGLVRALDRAAVDLWPGWTGEHLLPDGLHPSPAGQRLIAKRVLVRLSGEPGDNERSLSRRWWPSRAARAVLSHRGG